MKTKLSAIACLSLLSSAACADAIGVTAGVSQWSYDISGSLRFNTTDSANDIDVNDDLGYDDDSLGYAYVAIDHPLPMLPNIRISKTNIDSNANGQLTATFVYGDITFLANEAVSSDVKLDQTDITLYYRLLDNTANLDLGLNAKYIDAESTITGAVSGSESADISGWVPMLYIAVGIDLPFTGLSLAADGSFMEYQDSSFYDYMLRASYTTPWHIGIDAGYRSLRLELDDFDDSYSDVEFDGPFAGAYLKF